MITKDFENLFYEYGEVMKQIGKAETNDKVGMKEYNKLLSEKEKINIKKPPPPGFLFNSTEKSCVCL